MGGAAYSRKALPGLQRGAAHLLGKGAPAAVLPALPNDVQAEGKVVCWRRLSCASVALQSCWWPVLWRQGAGRAARAERAYAFLPWATDVKTCGQQVEVVSPSGASCGKLDFPVDSGACRTRELRLGLDGTVLQMLPASREQNNPPGSTIYNCTLRFWPGALR